MPDIYQKLWEENHSKILSNEIETDDLIDNSNDNRRGLTLRFRPSQLVLENIQIFLSKCQKIEPHQYFYPISDIHMTVLTIISGQSDFNLNQTQSSGNRRD